MQLQLEEYSVLCSFDGAAASGSEFREYQAVAVLYLRTLLTIYDTGYFDYEDDKAQVVMDAQAMLNHLLQFTPDEYAQTVDNEAFLTQLMGRRNGQR